MAAGPRLRAYLTLEHAMVDLDDVGDPLADELRDRMDPIWLMLSDEEHAALDARTDEPSIFAGSVGLRRDLAVRESVRAHFKRAA